LLHQTVMLTVNVTTTMLRKDLVNRHGNINKLTGYLINR